ncbi:unnamed protein product [Acanthoscelides obtectus]|uniref:OAR domain-containing protein n=1 Tax=Acanthoscelides obtectus TaxID=200917 RepID=A0A9P0NVQ8_ACAOB|nr:unnamed protein product [Acanthoscelides obtectus]CAK1678651.1 Homeobox protein orthopedia [Acanthoscelides obtectus]
MGDGLCGSGMFTTSDTRWGAVAGMTTGLGQLSQGSMGGFGQSLGQLNQGSGLSSALPISSASTVYQAHYGLNSLGDSMMSYCQTTPVSSAGGGGGGNPPSNGPASPPPPSLPQCSSAGGTPPVASASSPGGGVQEEEDVWRGHSIAALRRRASELNAAIPAYLQVPYDTHTNASVY